MSRRSSDTPSELNDWCSSARPSASACAAAGVSALTRASSPWLVWLRRTLICPS